MTEIGTVALKCSNSKCICQTLNKFGAYIVLNSNLRLITKIWCLVSMIFHIFSRWINWNGCNYMKLSYFESTLPCKVWLCSINNNEYISRKFRNTLILSYNDIWYFFIKITAIGTIAMKCFKFEVYL